MLRPIDLPARRPIDLPARRPIDPPARRLTTMYLADGRVVVTRRPRRALLPLAVLGAMTGRLRPAPDLLRFDCGTTYRISERIDWRHPDGAVELVLLSVDTADRTIPVPARVPSQLARREPVPGQGRDSDGEVGTPCGTPEPPSGRGAASSQLDGTRAAVEVHRRLVAARPETFAPDLARGLWNFAWVRATVRTELPQALDAAEEAVVRYEALASRWPQAFHGDLAGALTTLADVLDLLGLADGGATARQRAAAVLTRHRPAEDDRGPAHGRDGGHRKAAAPGETCPRRSEGPVRCEDGDRPDRENG